MSGLINQETLGDRIEDAEEELFLLYSRRAGFHQTEKDTLSAIVVSEHSHDQGSQLGLVDQRHDTVDLQFTFTGKEIPQPKPSRRAKNSQRKKENIMHTLDVTLAQDITGLRSRVGDTGGGVWRGSVLLAQALLEQFQDDSSNTLLNKETLRTTQALELGAGTGLLGLVLGTRVKSYICTDLPELVPLINKNVTLNRGLISGNLSVDALDWNDVHNCTKSSRRRLFSQIPGNTQDVTQGDPDSTRGFDLILAVDCIYNPSLIPPLLTTIDHFTSSDRSVAMIVMELRDEDVVRDFLTQWMEIPGWEIRRVGNDTHLSLLDDRFVIWIGTKSTTIT